MNHRVRDPFYSSPLPRTYYHPSPTRDVNSDVAIQSSEKNNHVSRKAELENPFETGSTFKLSALPQLRSVNTHVGDDMDDVYSRSDQVSNSTLLDTTHLTSSIDEKERATNLLPHQGEEDQVQGESISLIQKYIDRFRYSAPKSREERQKEKTQKKATFWWLNPDAQQNQEVKRPAERVSSFGSSMLGHAKEQWQSENTMKLTREAILELDKETSDLQQKADKLLSKSQLSLASSGPCVSTDGLGSSSALSECSFKTDPQPPYRPIFVNLQGNYGESKDNPVAPKQRFQTIEEEHPMSPQDVLARWRRRRMMDESQQRNIKITTTHRPMKTNNEMDIKLEEFRKKLFSQRALVTSEDIQFERQKMKMMIDSDEDHKEKSAPQRIEVSKAEDNSQHSTTTLQDDLILSRLREITSNKEPSNFGTSAQSNKSSLEQKSQNKQGDEFTGTAERNLCFNSNNVDTTRKRNGFCTDPNFKDQSSLNRNNTASHHQGFENQETEDFQIDDMTSQYICDARQQEFHLNSKAISDGQELYNHSACMNRKPKDLSDNIGDQKNSTINKCEKLFANTNEESSPQELDPSTQYHQILEAEKPCSETDNHGDKRQPRQEFCDNQYSSAVNQSDDEESSSLSVTSKKSERLVEHTKNKKKSRQRMYNNTLDKHSNEAELSDTSSKKSDKSSTRSIKSTKASKGKRNGDDQANQTSIRKEAKSGLEVETEDQCENDEALEQHDFPLRNEVPAPRPVEKNNANLSPSPLCSNVHKAIGETVMDHFFDGPSMISSVDSWASLFPRSPSHSLYTSTAVTPTKDLPSYHQIGSSSPSPSQHISAVSLNQQTMTSTPHKEKLDTGPCDTKDASDSTENGDGNRDSCDEFESDPLMSLLLVQKKEYLQKLELIELKLQEIGDGAS